MCIGEFDPPSDPLKGSHVEGEGVTAAAAVLNAPGGGTAAAAACVGGSVQAPGAAILVDTLEAATGGTAAAVLPTDGKIPTGNAPDAPIAQLQQRKRMEQGAHGMSMFGPLDGDFCLSNAGITRQSKVCGVPPLERLVLGNSPALKTGPAVQAAPSNSPALALHNNYGADAPACASGNGVGMQGGGWRMSSPTPRVECFCCRGRWFLRAGIPGRSPRAGGSVPGRECARHRQWPCGNAQSKPGALHRAVLGLATRAARAKATRRLHGRKYRRPGGCLPRGQFSQTPVAVGFENWRLNAKDKNSGASSGHANIVVQR